MPCLCSQSFAVASCMTEHLACVCTLSLAHIPHHHTRDDEQHFLYMQIANRVPSATCAGSARKTYAENAAKTKIAKRPKKKKWYGVQKAYLPAPRHKLSHVKDLAFALWAQWVAQHNADIYFLVARCGCYLHIFMLRQVEINGGAIIFEINLFCKNHQRKLMFQIKI